MTDTKLGTRFKESNKKLQNILRSITEHQNSDFVQLANQIDTSSREYLSVKSRIFGGNTQNNPDAKTDSTLGKIEGLQYLKIFDADCLEELSKRKSIGRDERQFYESLKDISPEKPLKEASLAAIERIEGLFEKFPNAEELLKYIRDFLRLRSIAKNNRSIYYPPICISGPPGIGKTAVIKAICQALEVDYAFYDFSAASSSWGLTGNDSSWSGSSPGLILKTLLHGGSANPIVHIDEIDKPQVNHNLDPYLSLHMLFERPQMYRFCDSYAKNLPVTAQHVMFMATANEVDSIPNTIRSRLRIIEMQAPSSSDMRRISPQIYQNLITSEDVEDSFQERLSDDVLDFLSNKSPRETGLILARALAAAAAHPTTKDRYQINITDCIMTIDEQDKPVRKVGFVW